MTQITLSSINYPDFKITFNGSFAPRFAGKIMHWEWDADSQTPEQERAAIAEKELEILCSRYKKDEGPLGQLVDSYGVVEAIKLMGDCWAKTDKIWDALKDCPDDEALQDAHAIQLRCYDRARDWVAHYPAQDFEDFGLMAAALLEVPPRNADGTDSEEFFHLSTRQCRALYRSAEQHIEGVLSFGIPALQSGCREESPTEIVQSYLDSEAA